MLLLNVFCILNTANVLGEIMKLVSHYNCKGESERDPDVRVTVVAGVCSPPPLFAFWEFDGQDQNNLSL